jgi:hypothetical protein
MRKRYAVLGLSLLLALALSVPALGGPTNPIASVSASVKSIANKALKQAKAAQSTANSALSTGNSALSTANSASQAAKTAQSSATEAKTAASSAQSTANTALSTAKAAQTTAESKLATTEFVAGNATTENTTTTKIAGSECPNGSQVTGGSFNVGGSESNDVTATSANTGLYGPGWLVTARAISGTPNWSLQAIAVCAKP